MAVPTAITDLSATIASNVPAGTDQAFPYMDDYLRAAYGFIRQGDTKAADVASASTVDLGAVVGRFVDVTGTTTITSFGTVAAGIWRIVTFTGALTLTHNATSLILPGGANITTAAGDSMVAESLGSGNWKIHIYMPAAGYPSKGYVDTGLSGKAAAAHTHDWSVISSRLFAEGDLTESAAAFNYPVLLTNVDTPDANYWFVTTLRRDVNNVAQTAVALAGNRMFMRSKNAGSWNPWVRCDNGEAETRSFAATGYARLPGGLMIQWGKTGSIVYYGSTSVTFPLTFPGACLSATASPVTSTLSSATGGAIAVTAIGASSMSLRNMHDSSSEIQWIAVGY